METTFNFYFWGPLLEKMVEEAVEARQEFVKSNEYVM